MKEPSILYPQVDPAVWAARYSLTNMAVPCKKCGFEQKLTTPFACDKWRGLQAELHGCGPEYQSATARSVDTEAEAQWRQIFSSVKTALSK